jgi:ATP-dependent protease Clp ATPase subunit
MTQDTISKASKNPAQPSPRKVAIEERNNLLMIGSPESGKAMLAQRIEH